MDVCLDGILHHGILHHIRCRYVQARRGSVLRNGDPLVCTYVHVHIRIVFSELVQRLIVVTQYILCREHIYITIHNQNTKKEYGLINSLQDQA